MQTIGMHTVHLLAASQLVEAVVEVNVMAVDWLANFSDYGVR